MTTSPRLRTSVTTAAVSAALVTGLAGCGMATRGESLAVVNGHPITQETVSEAISTMERAIDANNGSGQAAPAHIATGNMVQAMVVAPFVIDHMRRSGRWQPDAAVQNELARIDNPSPELKQVIESSSASRVMTKQDVDAVLQDMRKANIQINPRLGSMSLNLDTFGLHPGSPSWVVPTPPATAGSAGTPAGQ